MTKNVLQVGVYSGTIHRTKLSNGTLYLRLLKTNFYALKLELERYVYDHGLCEIKLCIVGVSPPRCHDFSECVLMYR